MSSERNIRRLFRAVATCYGWNVCRLVEVGYGYRIDNGPTPGRVRGAFETEAYLTSLMEAAATAEYYKPL